MRSADQEELRFIFTAEGSVPDIVETYDYGTEINIHAAPMKPGNTFRYWQGSTYFPGEKYTVTEDHIFEAVWQADPTDKKTPDQKQNNGTPKNNNQNKTDSKKAVNTGDNSLIIWMAPFILLLAEAVRFRM